MYQNRGPAKRNNHVCPKCLIKQWVTYEHGRNGVHVYEIAKQKFSFSETKGQRAFSFAIQDFIYVPEIDGQRINILEDWFSGFEGELAMFIKHVKEGKQLIEARTAEEAMSKWDKLLQGIFSLKNRNVYDIKMITKHFEDNPHLKPKLGIAEISNVEQLVLQNLIFCVVAEAEEYKMCDLVIFYNPSGDLLLTDRPMFIEDATDYLFFPVSPYHLIGIVKSTVSTPTYEHRMLPDYMVESYNQMVITRARDWVVSTKRELLEKYAPDMIPFDDKEVPESSRITLSFDTWPSSLKYSRVHITKSQ